MTALGLTKEQRDQLSKVSASLRNDRVQIVNAFRKEIRALPDTPAGRSRKVKLEAEQAARLAQLHNQVTARIGSALTPEQRAAFDAILGKRFDVAKLKAEDRKAGRAEAVSQP